MNYCDKCGGPRYPRKSNWMMVDDCRLCWLYRCETNPTWGWDRQKNRRWEGSYDWEGREEECNSTADSPATSTWLPPGARLPFFDPMTPDQERRSDEALLEAWLMYHRPSRFYTLSSWSGRTGIGSFEGVTGLS